MPFEVFSSQESGYIYTILSFILSFFILSVYLKGGFYMKKAGRYHNDYSPRYHEAFDIYEKARNHVKEQKKKERLRSLSVIEKEHCNRSNDDNTVSDKAPFVRNLSEEQESKNGGENDL